MRYTLIASIDGILVDDIAASLNKSMGSLIDPQAFGTCNNQVYILHLPTGYAFPAAPSERKCIISSAELFDPMWIGHQPLSDIKRTKFTAEAMARGALHVMTTDAISNTWFFSTLLDAGVIQKVEADAPTVTTVKSELKTPGLFETIINGFKKFSGSLGFLALPLGLLFALWLFPTIRKLFGSK